MTSEELTELAEEIGESSPLTWVHVYDELLDERGKPRPSSAHGCVSSHRGRYDHASPIGWIRPPLSKTQGREHIDRPGRRRVGCRNGICQRTETHWPAVN